MKQSSVKYKSLYTERQYFQSRTMRWWKWLLAICALLQIAFLTLDETGLSIAPLGVPAHLVILLVCLSATIILCNSNLFIQMGPKGIAVQYFPYQWRARQIGWEEIRQVRKREPGQMPVNVIWGAPGVDFTHVFMLTSPEKTVFNFELVTGMQLYVSTEASERFMLYLRTIQAMS